MSTFNVTNYADSSGNFPSTALQIQQGRAKAWFNLNGTGTIAERDSFNIANYTDHGIGDYTSTFTSVFPNVNYNGVWNVSNIDGVTGARNVVQGFSSIVSLDASRYLAPSTSAARSSTQNSAGNQADPPVLCASLFGD